VGGVVLGVAQELGTQWNPSRGDLVGFAIFLLVLVLRPQGLVARKATA
jgi:branched-subunit amino acid ABC-type transport system permease component